MSHAWRATGLFPYARDAHGNEKRQVFRCDNCGFETHMHSAPSANDKMPFHKPEHNEVLYVTCEDMVVLKVMEA